MGGQPMSDRKRIYARQEYLTPGADETVRIIAQTVPLGDGARLLDVASGKGQAAAVLAGQGRCRVVCVEHDDDFIRHTTAKLSRLGLGDRVSVLRADGRQIPLRDGAVDAAYCIGAPSIVGLEKCLREMARVVAGGGFIIVSDVVWRHRPGPLGRDWGWVASAAQVDLDGYVRALESAGTSVSRFLLHGRDAWEKYWRPAATIADDDRAMQHDHTSLLASEIADWVDLERRAVDAWLDYATFVARKPFQDH